MKNRRHNAIPDFSSKRPSPPSRNAPEPRKASPPPPTRKGKPQATSAKSGRRGQ